MIRRATLFLINASISLVPFFVVSPIIIFYIFSGEEASRVSGYFALTNTLLLVPIFYLLWTLVFSRSKSPVESLLSLHLENKSPVTVCKRVVPQIVGLYVLVFAGWGVLVLPYLLFYMIFTLFNKKSIVDIISQSHYLFQSKPENDL